MKFRFLLAFLSVIFFLPAIGQNDQDTALKKACLAQVQHKNWNNAIEDCGKAAELGSPAAGAVLGRIYEKGLHGQKNLAQAANWYELAAQNGSKEAAYRLAELWLTPNTGLGYEPAKAAIYLEKAYHNGHTKSGLALAAMLRAGRDIPANYEAAFRIYQDLSKKSREAAYQSGKMLSAGQGIDKNPKKAFYYYKIAAQAGLIKAQRDLGLAYFEGAGHAQSLMDAYEWLDIAAFQGDMEAAAALRLVENEVDESVARKARSKARAWLCENKNMACR